MPTYEYRCDRGHMFDVMQRMSDDPVTICTDCGETVQRVLQPVAVHFKGSGFYSTDYGKKGRGSGSESEDAKRNGSDKSDKGDSGSKDASASNGSDSSKNGSSKSEAKAGSGSKSSSSD